MTTERVGLVGVRGGAEMCRLAVRDCSSVAAGVAQWVDVPRDLLTRWEDGGRAGYEIWSLMTPEQLARYDACPLIVVCPLRLAWRIFVDSLRHHAGTFFSAVRRPRDYAWYWRPRA